MNRYLIRSPHARRESNYSIPVITQKRVICSVANPTSFYNFSVLKFLKQTFLRKYFIRNEAFSESIKDKSVFGDSRSASHGYRLPRCGHRSHYPIANVR